LAKDKADVFAESAVQAIESYKFAQRRKQRFCADVRVGQDRLQKLKDWLESHKAGLRQMSEDFTFRLRERRNKETDATDRYRAECWGHGATIMGPARAVYIALTADQADFIPKTRRPDAGVKMDAPRSKRADGKNWRAPSRRRRRGR
jgi:hypothetical protein